MMKIIAHRGYWLKKEEQNTLAAFERAIQFGFGIETDFRDQNEKLVISHGLPSQGSAVIATQLGQLLSNASEPIILGINIKADGLQDLISEFLNIHQVQSYFIFDMSIPDGVHYEKKGLLIYSRLSELENSSSFYRNAKGVWLDSFGREWYRAKDILNLLNSGLQVAIVSPELHGRPFDELWAEIKAADLQKYSNLSICTDFPLDAKRYFNE